MPATTPRSHDLARWTRGGDRLVLHADGRLWERRAGRRSYLPWGGRHTLAAAKALAAAKGWRLMVAAAGCGAEKPLAGPKTGFADRGLTADGLEAVPLVLYACDVFDAGELEARLERYQRRAAERRPLFADGPPDRATTVPASATAAPARPKKRPDPDDLDEGRGPRMYQCRGCGQRRLIRYGTGGRCDDCPPGPLSKRPGSEVNLKAGEGRKCR